MPTIASNISTMSCKRMILLSTGLGAMNTRTMLNCSLFILAVAVVMSLQGCAYTRQPGAIESGSEVGGTGDVGFTHESLGANKHLLTVTAAPGIMETEGSIAQRIHIFANKFAAKTCPGSFDFIHDSNFDQTIAASFMKRTKTYVFMCRGYRPKEVRKEKGFSTGSGFFVTDDGVIITNYHVIEDSKRIVVVLPGDKTEHVADVLQVDPANDVAILKIQATTVPIPMTSSSDMVRGQEVLTLGYPLMVIQGQEQKATFGRINALSGLKDDVRLMQIDATIQPGNSGSPLLNKRGEAIGVVTATLNSIVTLRASGSLPQNVNFAVKSDYILPTLRSALKNRYIAPSGFSSDQAMERVVSAREASVVLVIAR